MLASQALVAASEESYNANFESHRHGLATITDLIGSERDLMTARYTLVQTKADLLVSSSALMYAVGAQSASTAPATLKCPPSEKNETIRTLLPGAVGIPQPRHTSEEERGFICALVFQSAGSLPCSSAGAIL